jgi:hypothetical protein
VCAQGLQAPAEVGLDGAERAAEQLGDLRLAEVLPETEHQHGPLPGRQRGQRLEDGGPLGDRLGVPGVPLVHPLGQERRQQMGHASLAYAADVVVDQRAPYVEVDVVARYAPPAGVHLRQGGLHEVLGLVEVSGQHVRGAHQTGPGGGGVRGEVGGLR